MIPTNAVIMQSQIPKPTWWKHSKEVPNTREHPKTLFRPVKPNVLFFKGNSSRYGGKIKDKNSVVTDDAQIGGVNGNKNIYDDHRWVINNDENMAEEYRNEENNAYEQGTWK